MNYIIMEKKFGLLAASANEGQDISKLIEVMKKQLPDLEFIKPCEEGSFSYVDITQKGITKGFAVRKIREIFGIKKERTAVFGDAPNDEPMFEKAGIRVAVQNAKPQLKEQATFVTSRDNEQNGVGQGFAVATIVMREDLVSNKKLKPIKRTKRTDEGQR